MASLVNILSSLPAINIKELELRLKLLAKECNIEIIHLSIKTMLEEIKDSERTIKRG